MIYLFKIIYNAICFRNIVLNQITFTTEVHFYVFIALIAKWISILLIVLGLLLTVRTASCHHPMHFSDNNICLCIDSKNSAPADKSRRIAT